MVIKKYTPYVKGVVGCDFKLSIKQRFQILFCKNLSVIFIAQHLEKRGKE